MSDVHQAGTGKWVLDSDVYEKLYFDVLHKQMMNSKNLAVMATATSEELKVAFLEASSLRCSVSPTIFSRS